MSKAWKDGTSTRWRKQRIAVFKRDGAMCIQCGEDDKSKLHIDHIIPKRLVGDDGGLDNLRVLCRACNLSKGGSFFDSDATYVSSHVLNLPKNASVSHE